jgi:hypothetical protein
MPNKPKGKQGKNPKLSTRDQSYMSLFGQVPKELKKIVTLNGATSKLLERQQRGLTTVCNKKTLPGCVDHEFKVIALGSITIDPSAGQEKELVNLISLGGTAIIPEPTSANLAWGLTAFKAFISFTFHSIGSAIGPMNVIQLFMVRSHTSATISTTEGNISDNTLDVLENAIDDNFIAKCIGTYVIPWDAQSIYKPSDSSQGLSLQLKLNIECDLTKIMQELCREKIVRKTLTTEGDEPDYYLACILHTEDSSMTVIVNNTVVYDIQQMLMS